MSGNNSTDCNFTDVDNLSSTLQKAVHIPTFVLGLVLNLLAIRGFKGFLKNGERSITAIYMINLAIFDLVMVLSLPFKMVLSKDEKDSWFLCTMAECLYFISMYGSIFTVSFISLDRFLAIRYPMKASYLRSNWKTLGICFITWVLVWVGSIPVYTFHKNKNKFRCFHNMTDDTWRLQVVLPLEVFGFLLPLGVVAFCSCRTIHILLDRRGHSENWVQHRACIWTIVTNLVIFVVSFLPVHLGYFLQALVRNGVINDCPVKRGISMFLQLSLCISNVNCCLDIFYYYFVIKEFRMNLKTQQRAIELLVRKGSGITKDKWEEVQSQIPAADTEPLDITVTQ